MPTNEIKNGVITRINVFIVSRERKDAFPYVKVSCVFYSRHHLTYRTILFE